MTTAARPTPRRWRDADASPNPQAHSRPKTRRSRGDHGISWDKINKCYVGTISLGYDTTGKRRRRTVTGKTKAQVKDKLITLREEISAGVQTPATYTVEQCVRDWLDSLAIDPGTIATYRGQAEKWIYPRIGAAKLKDLKVTDIELFFGDIAKVLRRPSLVAIKSTLRRSIRRAQKHDLIIRNVAELADVPDCQPGRPSRAMTEEQAAQVLAAASGIAGVYRTVVTIGRYPGAAAHAATAANDLACGTRPRTNATFAHVSDDLAAATCWSCRAKLGLDSRHHPRLALNQARRRHQDPQVAALARAAQPRDRCSSCPPKAPGRRAPSRRSRLA